MTLVVPRIVNNVSFVSRINYDIHFSWQVQYLVKCKCHFSLRTATECEEEDGVTLSERCGKDCVDKREYWSSPGVVQSSTGVVLCSTE